jgi:nucleotide-binding universal stress UspA family protein
LVVRQPPRTAYERPALALDLDEAAVDAVRALLRLVPPPRPRVEVIHAFSVPYHGLVYPSLSEDEAEERKDELGSHAAREVSKRLSAAVAKAGVRPEDVPFWRTHVRYGSPRMVVQKVMKKTETDLLVLGTRGHSGAAYVFLGTVAGDLLRAVDCDVLVVPPDRSA